MTDKELLDELFVRYKVTYINSTDENVFIFFEPKNVDAFAGVIFKMTKRKTKGE